MVFCRLCGAALDTLTDLEQAEHLDQCMDKQLSLLHTELPPPAPAPPSDMPAFDTMAKADVLQLLDRFGIKKSLDMPQARSLLKDIWLYQHRNIYPQFLLDTTS